LCTFTKAKKYSQKAKDKLAFHYLSEVDPEEENYSKSADRESPYFSAFKSEVLELFEETSNEAEALDGNTVKGKVALLFAEILQKELKDCEGDNCQERGKKYVFATKVLVVSKEDALQLLNLEYRQNTTSEQAISQVAFPWLHLPNITILKPVFSNTPVNAGYDEKVLVKEYTRCIKDFVATLEANKLPLEQALKNLKNYCTGYTGSVAVVNQLLESVKATGVLENKPAAPASYAMVYDYLWCFVKAYAELQAEAQQLKARCFVAEEGFPNHLLLGIINSQNTDFEAPVDTGYSIYRHHFQASFAQSAQALTGKNLTVLLNRLQLLAGSFDGTGQAGKEIKITPGGGPLYPLSQQAIPFYLKQPVSKAWNSVASHPVLSRFTTSYREVNEAQPSTTQTPYNSQPSAFQGNHSFFRIEGVHGQTAVKALNTVFQVRKKHGLAFEVLMLRINEKAPFNHAFNFTINEDIESMYQVVRAEVMRQINLSLSYLHGLFIKSDKFSHIQAVLTRELEKSYIFFLDRINFTLLAQPLTLVLDEAITASNITSNYKAGAVTTESKYKELESAAAKSKDIYTSSAKGASIGLASTKTVIAGSSIFQPIFTLDFSLLFFHTLGNLVGGIKSSDKFKKTSNISFYSQLLLVAKAMQKNEKQAQLFLYALQLFCALKLQEEYLDDNFLELDIAKFRSNLDDELIRAAAALIDFLNKVTNDTVKDDEFLTEVRKETIQGYAERIRFDDDWVKIIQLDAENKKRNGGLGVENLLERFVKLHPGIAHGCGVPHGGTYIMVYDSANQVVADFNLPYIISSHLRPIQYTLLETKTLTLSGTVRDAAGKPVETRLLVGTATIITDKEGFYNALVSENTTVKVVCKTPGFEDFEQDVVIKDKPQTLDIQLKASVVKQTTTTVKFMNAAGAPIKADVTLVNLADNKTVVAKAGILPLTDTPKTEYKFRVQDASFADKSFSLTIGDTDKEEPVVLTELDFIRIQLVSRSGYIPTLLKNVKIINPEMEVDATGMQQGRFVTKERLDTSKTATVEVIYGGRTFTQKVKPGKEENNVVVEGSEQGRTTTLRAFVGVFYPQHARRVVKIPSVLLNDNRIELNAEINTGEGAVVTDGRLTLRDPFPGITLEIQDFDNVSSVIVLIDSTLLKERATLNRDSVIALTTAMNSMQIRMFATIREEFAHIQRAADLKVPNFYVMLLADPELGKMKQIMRF
jgi:hypothetical protein